ncbi:hypothetical protein LOV38_004679 [Salmonella enterica]|nr:hypothetical protein [Salmonella enterica]EDC9390799.1 hypothetical protein [Salmonella enterica subsp. enterica serovar Dublin]EBC5731474.1 hypothetical protein [Salmonella enterica]EEB7585813.1 hypothetical protein [Salmonella enterica subsp. enterica serovar Dublin]EEC2050009.1 hypothetical protein [Salmonella enterica subsp. enterica serovar Dublin]
MTASVAATELAKLGKCEAMIKKVASHPRPALSKRPQSPQGTDSTLGTAGAKRRIYQLVFSATVAAGALTMLAAWTTS